MGAGEVPARRCPRAALAAFACFARGAAPCALSGPRARRPPPPTPPRARARERPAPQAARDAREARLRADAAALAASHDAAAAAEDRHHWLVFTVPEVPVAGAECVVYFNKSQSPTLG
jgi:hypothetical protein